MGGHQSVPARFGHPQSRRLSTDYTNLQRGSVSTLSAGCHLRRISLKIDARCRLRTGSHAADNRDGKASRTLYGCDPSDHGERKTERTREERTTRKKATTITPPLVDGFFCHRCLSFGC